MWCSGSSRAAGGALTSCISAGFPKKQKQKTKKDSVYYSDSYLTGLTSPKGRSLCWFFFVVVYFLFDLFFFLPSLSAGRNTQPLPLPKQISTPPAALLLNISIPQLVINHPFSPSRGGGRVGKACTNMAAMFHS